MVTFIIKAQVETILISLDANARNQIQISNVIPILARIGFKLTKASRKYLNLNDILGSRENKEENTLFEIHVLRHSDAEVIKYEKRHGIKVPHMPGDYKHLKINTINDKFLVWYKSSEDEEWTEVSDI
jgi:hypothetical protein